MRLPHHHHHHHLISWFISYRRNIVVILVCRHHHRRRHLSIYLSRFLLAAHVCVCVCVCFSVLFSHMGLDSLNEPPNESNNNKDRTNQIRTKKWMKERKKRRRKTDVMGNTHLKNSCIIIIGCTPTSPQEYRTLNHTYPQAHTFGATHKPSNRLN